MLDDLRSYLQMASGLTEATTAKAKEAVVGLLSTGMSLTSKAVPAPEVMGQVQELADDLVATSKNNRDVLTGMIRAEVDRAVGRMGFVREDELAALRRHVQRLERQIADLQESSDVAPAAAPAAPAEEPVAAEPEPVAAEPEPVAAEPAEAEVPAPEAEAADIPKKKKKKIIVDPSAGA